MGRLLSNQVRSAVSARLQDATYGYNAAIAQFSAQLGISLPTVDFGTDGAQYFQAYVSVEDIETDTPSKFPIILLYSVTAENVNLEKFREFAGPIAIGIEVMHSWDKEQVDPTLHEDTADVVEAAMFQIFNENWAGQSANYPPCIVYNGRMKAAKYPLQPFGDGYLLRQAFALGFQLMA
jgi:hypothetical protein